jgi:hypothetical protein
MAILLVLQEILTHRAKPEAQRQQTPQLDSHFLAANQFMGLPTAFKVNLTPITIYISGYN